MENQAYISHVHLKGYKSIRDMEVDLLPGLNIIIGPNGSGKTNFLEFIYANLYNSEESRLIEESFETEIEIYKTPFVQKNIKKGSFINEQHFLGFKIENKIYISNKLIKHTAHRTTPNNEYDFIKDYLQSEKPEIPYYLLLPTLVSFNNPLNENLRNSITARFIRIDKDKSQKKFVFYSTKDSDIIGKTVEQENLISLEESKISEKLNIKMFVIETLRQYTPIKNLKIETHKLRSRLENHLLYIDNIEFSFFVNENWLSWRQLSDGTRRLFLIIISILNESVVFFLEEPELGIHPDQLHLLMDFLKEQSKEKQIIITTHSPEVLNILGKEELDRIIITRYDDEKGTQMHHLSPKQIRKGQIYIEEVGNLKSFWVHSNLEEYEAE